jgi:hypothetical protein
MVERKTAAFRTEAPAGARADSVTLLLVLEWRD